MITNRLIGQMPVSVEFSRLSSWRGNLGERRNFQPFFASFESLNGRILTFLVIKMTNLKTLSLCAFEKIVNLKGDFARSKNRDELRRSYGTTSYQNLNKKLQPSKDYSHVFLPLRAVFEVVLWSRIFSRQKFSLPSKLPFKPFSSNQLI